jgi:hypothetical protein
LSKGWFVKSAEWLEKHHLAAAQQFGPIALTLIAIWVGLWAPGEWEEYNKLTTKTIWFWVSQWTPWLALLTVIAAVYGGIRGAIDSKTKDKEVIELKKSLLASAKLSNQLEEAQLAIDHLRVQHAETVYNVTSDYLGHLSNDHLNYNDTERASLYLHNGSRFILAGRYSKNLELNKANRSAFPDNEGCIGQTWQHGGKYFIELPDNETEYLEFLKTRLNVDKGIAKNLRMKSKAYCSFAVEEGYKRIGIVMFESTKKGVLDEKGLESLVFDHQAYLIEMLKRTINVNALVAYQNGE